MSVDLIISGLLLSLFAGLSTSIGALAVFVMKDLDSNIISLSMGFSAGVMIGVSIFELLPEALNFLGILLTGIAFLLGMIIVALLDFLIPHEYMHEQLSGGISNVKNPYEDNNHRLMKTGMLVALGIAIHNLPEGFVTITGTLHSIELGIVLAIAIAFHNIPEGLSVAITIFSASGEKNRAFKISFLSGLAEPIGAVIGLVVLLTLGTLNIEIIEISLAFVAGIMIFISLDELLPTAYETSKNNGKDAHVVTGGILLGITVILATLILLG
ncbi:MAG: ZIP family metal transporter [Candidatus Hodarchaeales archaeon]